MENVHYCDREQMTLAKAVKLRKKFLACNENFDKCDGNCKHCEHDFVMAEYHKAEAYVWTTVELAVMEAELMAKGEQAYDENVLQG